MTRLSREQKRELKRAGRAPAPAGLTPIDVRVSAEAGATVGGMPVPAAAGESLQTAALDYLHRLALATGHPVLATVHDERIGYVVPLQIHVDGSSRFAGEPVQVAEPRGDVTPPSRPAPAAAPAAPPAPPAAEPVAAPGPRRDRSTYVLRAVPESAARAMPEQERTAPEEPPRAQPQGQARVPSQQHPVRQQPPQRDVRPQPHAQEPPPQPQPQVKREPSTMRLSAVEPAPSAVEPPPSTGDPVGHPVAPERPRREPSTLPLTAAKATAPGQEPAGAPAEPPAAAEPRREPPTMPLTAAKPAAGAVAPSTFVLRAVPEPKDGPLARHSRTPDLPLTLPGIAVTPDDAPHRHGETAHPAPTTGPAAGEYGGSAGTAVPGADAYGQAGADSGHAAAPPSGAYGQAADQSVGVAVPPAGEFGPARGDAAVHTPEAPSVPTSAASPDPSDAAPSYAPHEPAPAAELSPSALEPQPLPPGRQPAAAQAPVHQAPARTAEAEPERPAAVAPDPVGAHLSDAVPPSGPVSLDPQPWPPVAPHTPPPAPVRVTAPEPALAPAPPEESAADPYSAPPWKVADEEGGPRPAPVREFDAVAESVLDLEESDGAAAPSPFAEPVSRINEAVKMGRIQEAAEMAEHTVAQATATLGPQHTEVLRLRELTAYIAYLAGDALRSFHLSLDLAALRHRLRDPRAAYGNIQSAAAAWRAVRDPLQGLHLGRDLIAVWAELAADTGPAADDVEQLEKARTRMGRLAERARALDADPYARSPHAHGQ
ncbi:hypothetical protein [Streptomyces heilongjiangensis]|uniref:Tetratricopeptide repeat protein n=1 Tax=Streptomyces heilongjiangensis TaxID=945052 RepID=A0ABW1BC08_9ACTN